MSDKKLQMALEAISLLMQWFAKLNSRTEWSFSLMSSVADSAKWTGWKAASGCPINANGADKLQKLDQQILTDNLMSQP